MCASLQRKTSARAAPTNCASDAASAVVKRDRPSRSAAASGRPWSFTGDHALRELSHHDNDVFGDLRIGHVAYSPDGPKLVTTSYTGWVARVWAVASGRLLSTYEYGFGMPSAIRTVFAPTGRHLHATVDSGVVDATNSAVVRRLEAATRNAGWAIHRSERGFSWTVWLGRLRVYDVETGHVVLELATEEQQRTFRPPLDRRYRVRNADAQTCRRATRA